MENPALDESDPGFPQVSQFDRADQICDAFEREWLNGQQPQMDSYLARVPEAERDNLRRELEVIQRDYEQRCPGSGETPGAHETVCANHPAATRGGNGHPAQIGRYRIERFLGRGGFGIVYLARDEQLQRLVAIKVPHAELVADAGNSAVYLSEARTVANLDHRHIVPVYDVGATARCPCYVVSKHVDGCDLASRLKAARPERSDAVELVATVAEALHYAHTQGVVHRDVKPGNILIDGDGRPYVVDFGLALREENIGTGPKYLGTLAYMSPEQASGEGHRVDARSDIFSLDADPGVHGSASWSLRQWDATLPEIDESVLPEEQKQHLAKLTGEIEEIQQRVAAYGRDELAAQQAVWERKLQEQPAETPDILSDGLIAHYPFDETEGVQARGAVKDQLAGSYQGQGQPQWVSGVMGGAVRLAGDGEVVGGRPLTVRGDGPFSYGCWIYHEQGLPAVLLSTRNSPRRVGFDLSIERDRSLQVIIAGEHPKKGSDQPSGYSRQYLAVKTKSAIDSESQPVWHHVLVAYDGSQEAAGVSIYVDGALVPAATLNDELAGSELVGLSLSELPVYIGSRRGGYRFQGKIDDVRIFNRKLTSNDVQLIYATGVKMLARLPTAERTAEQQTLLVDFYPSVDPTKREMENRLAATETEWRACRWRPTDHWYINSQGQTMVVFDKLARTSNHNLKHSFAISNHEVTYEKYSRFLKDPGIDSAIAPTDDCPAHVVSWFLAAEYCNWLNQQEGIPKEQWVYEPNADGNYEDGMRIKENYAELIGYRLPTEAEWEYACRGGSSTTYSFGEPVSLLRNYAQYILNSGGRSRPVGSQLPNDAGLFDMHGNLWEWTLEAAYGQFSPVRADTSRALHGGAFYLDAALVRPETRTNYAPSMQITNIGFRPARIHISSP